MLTKTLPPLSYNTEIEADLIARAIALRPLLQKNAPLHDKARRVSDEVFKEVSDAGFWGMSSPRRWGGYGTSAVTMALVGLELAKGDPAVGWIYNIIHGTTWVASLGPDSVQEAVFRNDGTHPTICGVASPPGIAQEVEGGYVLNGRWGYASGSRHAQWGQWGCNIKQADGTVIPGGFAYVPMSEVTIEDTWFMTGMRGTGSETVVAKDVFVPKERFFYVAKLGLGKHEEGKKHVGEAQDYWSLMPFLRSSGYGVLVGIAEDILDRLKVNLTKRPIVYTSYARQADSAAVQHELGLAASKVAAARALMIHSAREVDEAGLKRTPMTLAERAASKGMGSLTVQLLQEAVTLMMTLAGSGAFAEANDLSRLFRDFSVGSRHIANIPYVGYEIFGKELLGVPNISPPDFI